MTQTTADTDIDATLAETERSGLRRALFVRNCLIGFVIVFIGGTQGPVQGAFGMAVTAVFLGVGLAYRALVISRRDAMWMRYAFITLDMGLLAVFATQIPLSLHGEVPQIFVFRVYGAAIFFFLLATSALSLSPRLVLWTGGMAVLALWGAWGWIVLGMDRVVTWSEITDDRTAEKYIALVLDPNMVAVSNRVIETALLLATAAVTAAAVERARRMLRRQVSAERARSRTVEVFGRFVPQEVSETLAASDGILPPDAREASVLFVDVAGFTSFAETAPPARVIAVMDAFFDAVSEIVVHHGGVPISLIGDAALAAFNAPLDNPGHARSAVDAARALIAASTTRTFADETLTIRVGVATGPVAAGTVGGRGRRAYTLYGDTVNLAQRLEALNKDHGTGAMISDATWTTAGQPEDFGPVGSVTVKGRAQPAAIYALVGRA